MAWLVTRPVEVIGGAVIPRPLRLVPTKPGVLVIMNHQSLFDIPIAVQAVADGYPRIVTRARYGRFVPLISHMVRLYQHPVIDPSADPGGIRQALDQLQRVAVETDVPLVVFPEGTRTKNGEIGRFKLGALARILAARPWTVYVFVADGFWRAAKYKDFLRGVSQIDGRVEHVTTVEWTDPESDPVPFLNDVREVMVKRLAAMRREEATA